MNSLQKKLNYLFFALPLLIFLANCSSGDGGDKGSGNDLIGLWTVTSTDINFDVDGQTFTEFLTSAGVPADQIPALVDILETEFKDGFEGTIEFKSDNTYINTFENDTDPGTWNLSGSTLTIDSDTNDPVVTQVTTLNASILVVSLTEIETDDLDGDGKGDTLTISVTSTLNK